MSPTARTLKLLRDQGYHAEVVERWIPQRRIRKDLFGFIDIVAIMNGQLLGVQATSGSNVSARVKKIKESPLYRTWLSTGAYLHVIGWRKLCRRGPNGKRLKSKAWEPLIVHLYEA